MLHDFIRTYRDELISRTREKVAARPWPSASTDELKHGVPLFLTQLCETLRLETSGTPFPPSAIGATASRHGRDLLGMGFTVSQVVHDYGDVCQAVTELAVEKKAAITTEEFHTLNRCLDTAIAEAVTEYGRLKDEATSLHGAERLGQLAHELRNQIQTALLSFQVLKAGTVGVSGSTGTVLGRSLVGLRDLIDSTLSEVRLTSTTQRRDHVSLQVFVEEVAVAANLHAEYRDILLAVDAVDPALTIHVDPRLLAAALMNLLHNAFKYTQPKGHVSVRTHAANGRVFIEVEDECGGLPDPGDLFRPFGDRRGSDRSGLGLGLSISRKAVSANGGEIHARNVAGKGCVFTIELPQASPPSA